MSASLIIDCSLAMTWCFEDESTSASLSIQDRLVDEAALVPPHWFLEVTNVLAMAEKRRRITPANSQEFIRLLRTFAIEVDDAESSRAFDHFLPLCRAHKLTSYDAAYLELAQRRNLPLATLDAALRAAAQAVGVTVLG